MKLKLPFIPFTFAAAGLILALHLPAAEKNDPNENWPGSLSKADYKFVTKVARGGMLEVQAGQLAVEKARNPAVREFGEQMVAHHSKLNEELKQLATTKDAALPAGLEEKQKKLEKLQSLSGAEFDQAYAKLMVSDRQEDLREFQDYAKDAHDADLKAFAAKTVPVLEQHLAQAKRVASEVKGK